jgi:drug/metabolite transporter (DMT)-like permease
MHKETIWFILLNILLLGCFTLNTLYLESLYKNETNITNYLVFYSSVCNYIVALIFSYGEIQPKISNTTSNTLTTQITHFQYIIISLGTFISSQTGMIALDYISMPTRILLKSCKSIPIIVVGLFSGKSYPVYKFISIIALSSGTYFYSYIDNNSDQAIGIGFALVSLVSEGLVGVYQDNLVEKYQVGTFTLMQNIQMWRIVFSILYIYDWWKFYQFMHQYSITIIFLGLSGAGTQVCIFISLNRYGSLSTAMMDNFRKVFNIILSIVMNGYNLTNRQSLGLTLGISGILVNVTPNHPFFSQKIHCKQCLRRIKIS